MDVIPLCMCSMDHAVRLLEDSTLSGQCCALCSVSKHAKGKPYVFSPPCEASQRSQRGRGAMCASQ